MKFMPRLPSTIQQAPPLSRSPAPGLRLIRPEQQRRFVQREAFLAFKPVTRNINSRPRTFTCQNRKISYISSCGNLSSNSFVGYTKMQAPYSTDAAVTMGPIIESLYEKRTGTWQYIVADPSTNKAVIIDAVLDYDPATQMVSTTTADDLLATVRQKNYHIERILETHAHADHLTAASYLQHRLHQEQGSIPPICIGKRINQVQKLLAAKYGISASEYEGVFDCLFEDEQVFEIGQLTAKVLHLPGHTPDHIGYQIADNVFCGDSIFHADIGTARCDFPGGSAKSLYNSAQKLLSLPDDVKIWTGHDYPACPERCDAVPWMSVRDHKEKNKHLSKDIKEDDFLTLRQERDAGLAAPKLLDASLQINIRAGRLPHLTENGQRLMSLPLKVDGHEW